jgi:23S rRNA (guanosine2251-2'-O)-methyltransferase
MKQLASQTPGSPIMKGKHSASGFKKSRHPHRHAKDRKAPEIAHIYGVHAAEAALANPKRCIRQIYATLNAAQRLAPHIRPGLPEITPVTPKDLDRMLGGDTVHQGILIEAEFLPEFRLADLQDARFVLFLDQITDPHNVGAILRSAAAFGVDAVITTLRNSPPLDGALAKSASGGLEYVPVVLVTNLARALAEAAEMGFTRIGLDSGGAVSLEEVEVPAERLALVLGAEHRGLRQLTREHCEAIYSLTTFGSIASLNVSNAAAIALHLMAHKMRQRRLNR